MFLVITVLGALAAGPEGCGGKDRSGQAVTAAVTEEAARSNSTGRSPQELEDYRRAALVFHEKAKQRGLKNVHSTVTLAEPLSVEDAVALIETNRLHPRLLYSFSEGDDGQILTQAVSVDERGLDQNLASITRPTKRGGRLLGIVSMVAAVPVERLNALQGDPRVYLVDIQADEHFAPENRGNRKYVHHLAWDLYQVRKDGKSSASSLNPRG